MSVHANKKYILIGASSDVGQAIAHKLLREGAQLSLFARNIDSINEEGQFDEHTGNVSYHQLDLFNENDIKTSIKEACVSQKANGLIYCAGIHKILASRMLTAEKMAEFYYLNATAFGLCFKEAMSNKNSDSNQQRSVVAISSIAHLIGEIGLAGYSSSKAALVTLCRSLAVEGAAKNIRVNSISPGWLESKVAEKNKLRMSPEAYQNIVDSYPLGVGTPKDVAELANFLLSDGARWLTGQDIILDGGRTNQ